MQTETARSAKKLEGKLNLISKSFGQSLPLAMTIVPILIIGQDMRLSGTIVLFIVKYHKRSTKTVLKLFNGVVNCPLLLL